jgi:ribosomal protein S18 acetylase RimI-like enzyme
MNRKGSTKACRSTSSVSGGFSQFSGAKLNHKGLIWGMYVSQEMGGTSAADAFTRVLIDHAMTVVESAVLTVIASNTRAVRFYERWGFRTYETETRSGKVGMDDHLDEYLMARSFARSALRST